MVLPACEVPCELSRDERLKLFQEPQKDAGRPTTYGLVIAGFSGLSLMITCHN